MPELPDVEVFERYADATSLHVEIEDVWLSEQLVTDTDPQRIRDGLRGASLTETRRHGKHLFLRAGDDGWLRLHFGMTGTLEAYETGDAPDHTELRIDFVDGSHLAYVDQRKFGEIGWVDDVDDFVAERGLGPDPLVDELDDERFRELVEGRRGTIKSTLMNQDVIAGLGNVYVDEILFQVGVHPETEASDLDADVIEDIRSTMYHVLDVAIDRGADVDELPDTWLLPIREEGVACPRCDGEIRHTEVSGRTTYFCGTHQD